MLFIARNCGVMQDIILFQLSQLEDSRRENRDLSSSSQVCLQHLWSHRRRGPHYQVGYTAAGNMCVVIPRPAKSSHSFTFQVLPFQQGWRLQQRGKSTPVEDSEECCRQFLISQVFLLLFMLCFTGIFISLFLALAGQLKSRFFSNQK